MGQNNRASLPQTETFKSVSQRECSFLLIDHLRHFVPVTENKLTHIYQVTGIYQVLLTTPSLKTISLSKRKYLFHLTYENKYTERLQN